MSQYETCEQCNGWINTEHTDFMVLSMHDGREVYVHKSACSVQYIRQHERDIKSYQVHLNVRIGGKKQ